MTRKSSRRSILKGVAATGTAATGLAAFGGQAAGQRPVNVNAGPLFANGLIVVQGINIQDVLDTGDVTVEILNVDTGDISVNVEDVQVLNDNVVKILNNVDVNVENVLNQNQVTVQVSILGDIVGTDVVNVPGNLR